MYKLIYREILTNFQRSVVVMVSKIIPELMNVSNTRTF